MSEQIIKTGSTSSRRGHIHTQRELDNLRSFDKMSKEEHRALSSKGGIATREKMKKQRTFKEAAEWLMSLPAFESDNKAVEALRAKYPDVDNTQAMVAAVMKRIIEDGDARALAIVRDTTGELPEQTVNVKNSEPMTINIKTIGG